MIARSTGPTWATVVAWTTVIAVPTVVAVPTVIAVPTAPVVVAISAVPVIAPPGIPELAGTPLREGPWLGLRVRRDAEPRKSQTGGHRECHCK
jgi:hypothetical protein